MRESARCAAAIKGELREKFPGIKFSVTSQTYSMGSSVNVNYTGGPSTEDVYNIIKKYQYGHFDGMTDYYDNSNCRDDIPQVKYVFADRKHAEDEILVEIHDNQLQTRYEIRNGEKYRVAYHEGSQASGRYKAYLHKVIQSEKEKQSNIMVVGCAHGVV